MGVLGSVKALENIMRWSDEGIKGDGVVEEKIDR